MGILDENKEKIFQRYQQTDDFAHINREGSGIGLSLVKSYVEMHEGKISVESIYGHGSDFIIKLPITLMSKAEGNNRVNHYADYSDRMNVEFAEIND